MPNPQTTARGRDSNRVMIFMVLLTVFSASRCQQPREGLDALHTLEMMDLVEDLPEPRRRKLRVRHQRAVLRVHIAPLDAARTGSPRRVHGAREPLTGPRHQRHAATPTPLVRDWRRCGIEFDEVHKPCDDGIENLPFGRMDPGELLVGDRRRHEVWKAVDRLHEIAGTTAAPDVGAVGTRDE